jgi:hypothetical protein
MNKLTTQEIEMFSKATEIQEMWQPSVGDVFISRIGQPTIVAYIDPAFPCIVHTIDTIRCGEREYNRNLESLTWIPSQEQLQNITEPDKSKVHRIDVVHLCYPRGSEWTPDVFSTMRLLWLAFVMYQVFDKVWYANKWCAYGEDRGNVLLPDRRI